MTDLLLSLLVPGALLQQPQTAALQRTETSLRFEQALSIRAAGRAAQPVKVSLRDWVVRNDEKASITATGMLIVHVRAGGPVVTDVNGQRNERKEDDFFVVAAGATLSVETGNDTVVLTVLEVQR